MCCIGLCGYFLIKEVISVGGDLLRENSNFMLLSRFPVVDVMLKIGCCCYELRA